ncbi:SHOCT domain-containing protein [Cryobacterium sp. PH29-G1]|uniref:SHOCT domain-containing protein n=1 Tax=Cryobacterium sp. PH29-G1 TaxID=3046211 RepID=UPI0024BA1211|nr:SHOCT domain-containing protein [Cryobacterium sp. PH29-G1]MDJ0348417.1 SHOCT domain-containing protein [Cryobacterium sp. PH29-G1]
MMWDNGTMGWSWGFGLLALVGVAIVVYVVIRLLSKNGGSDNSASSASARMPAEVTSARKILDERFARGEISAEQYREQIRVLGDGR